MIPLVSIIVPCYNQAHFLNESLHSVLNQTFMDWECIVVNDGSPDNTEEVVKEYLQRDSRFKYIKKDNGGLSSARNAGIRVAVGNFILPLDADDLIGTEYLEKAITAMRQDEALELVYCQACKFGLETEKWILPKYSYSLLLTQNIIFCSCIFIKKNALGAGLYNETIRDGLEDWDFVLRLLNENSKVLQLSESLFFYRTHGKSMRVEMSDKIDAILKVRENIFKSHVNEISKYHGDLLDLIAEKEILKHKLAQMENYIPKRSFRNLVKFILGRKLLSF